jgi:hypothetical protein
MLHTSPIHGVIPAKAGTSVYDLATGTKTEVPAFAGMTQWTAGRSVGAAS